MDKSTSILALARNSKSALIATVESLRNFVDIENVSLIVVDNASDDGLSEWAQAQKDLSYVYMDHGFEPWGSVLNQVIQAFEIQGMAMILAPGMMLTPSGISSMSDALKSAEPLANGSPADSSASNHLPANRPLTVNQASDNQPADLQPASHPLAAVAAVNNTASSNIAAPDTPMKSYQEALEYANLHENDSLKQTMEVEQFCTMFSVSAYNSVGRFQDDLKSLTGVFNDFSRKLLLAGFRMAVCRNTVAFNAVGQVLPEEIEYGQDDLTVLHRLWNTTYFGLNGNYNLVSKIQANPDQEISVLEIGCDCGATLFDIKQVYPKAKIIGCDINETSLKVAACVCDKVFTSNIDTDDLPLPEGSLDYIIFGDVLEHLRDPEAVLVKIQKNLKPDGHVLASIPNLMNLSVIKMLLHGDFTYADMGLLDRTHIHFFTYNEILRMFYRAGYEPKSVSSVSSKLSESDEKLIDTLLTLDNTPERFMYQTFQYVIDAVRKRGLQKTVIGDMNQTSKP